MLFVDLINEYTFFSGDTRLVHNVGRTSFFFFFSLPLLHEMHLNKIFTTKVDSWVQENPQTRHVVVRRGTSD
jgi:hypothetical protein